MSEIETEIENNDVDTGFNEVDATKMPKRTGMRVEVLDHPKSVYWWSINQYSKQRERIDRRLEELKRKVADGRYHGGEVAIAKLSFPYTYTIDENGKKVTKTCYELLMNGQHQCLLVQETGIPQEVTVKEFQVDDPEQLPVLFAQFDQPGGIRSAGQIAHTYTDRLPEWNAREITTISGAISWLARGTTVQTMTVDERIGQMLSSKYFSHATWAKELIYDNNGRHDFPHMARQPVVAAVIKSHFENPEKAQAFWHSVKTGADCSGDSPQLTLRNWLMTVVIGNTSGNASDGTRKKKTDSADVFHKCNIAFESFLKGEKLTKLHAVRKRKKATI